MTDSNTVEPVNDAPTPKPSQDWRPPRGALIVLAVGLLACVVAALATASKGEGEAAHLEWVQVRATADSKQVPVPGGGGEMQLTENGIRSTGTNVSGYSLFRISSNLKISAGSPIGGGRILCSIKTHHGTEIGQTSGGLRATYPRSSEGGIFKQEVPESVLIDFSSHSSELALLEVADVPDKFTNERGVKLEWPEYEVGTEHLKYFLPAGKPKRDLELPFYSIWKTTAVPAGEVSCTLTTSSGSATIGTKMALKKRSPPIDEQAEAEKAEEKEEQEGEEG